MTMTRDAITKRTFESRSSDVAASARTTSTRLRKIDGLRSRRRLRHRRRARARRRAQRRECRAFTSYEEMLAARRLRRRRRLHAVGAARGTGRRSRRAPASTSSPRSRWRSRSRQADDLVQACDDAGVHLFVVKQNRLNPPVQLLKRARRQGPLRPDLSGEHRRFAGSARRIL